MDDLFHKMPIHRKKCFWREFKTSFGRFDKTTNWEPWIKQTNKIACGKHSCRYYNKLIMQDNSTRHLLREKKSREFYSHFLEVGQNSRCNRNSGVNPGLNKQTSKIPTTRTSFTDYTLSYYDIKIHSSFNYSLNMTTYFPGIYQNRRLGVLYMFCSRSIWQHFQKLAICRYLLFNRLWR